MNLTKNAKSVFSFLFRVALSVGLLWFVFSKIDTSKTVDILKTADLSYIIIGAIVFFGVNCILLYRWFIFIKALDLSATVKSVIQHFFYGLFGNLFLPSAIGGDLIKVIGLCKDSTQKPKVVASVLLDRLSGFASIILIEIGVLILGYSFVMEDKALTYGIIMIGMVSFGFTAVLFNEKIYSFVCKVFNRLPKIKAALMSLHYDIALLKQKHNTKEGFKAIALACSAQFIHAFSWFLVAKALHQEFDLSYFIVFVPLLCIASSFPSIGGLGVREAGAVYLFSKIGMDPGVAVSLSLINFLFMVMVGLVGGIIYVYTLSVGRVQRYSSNAAGIEPGEA